MDLKFTIENNHAQTYTTYKILFGFILLINEASLLLVSHLTVSGELLYSTVFTTSPWLLRLHADTAQTYWPMSTSCKRKVKSRYASIL